MATLVRALQAVSVANGISIAAGAVASVDDALATSLISAGICEAVTDITPEGKITISANGTDINVAQYATADVAVPEPTGKINITANGTGINIAQYAEADVAVESGFEVGVLHVTANVPEGATNVSWYATVDSGEGYLKEDEFDSAPPATFDVYGAVRGTITGDQTTYDGYFMPLDISYELNDKTYTIDYENSTITNGIYNAGSGNICLDEDETEGSIAVVFKEYTE